VDDSGMVLAPRQPGRSAHRGGVEWCRVSLNAGAASIFSRLNFC